MQKNKIHKLPYGEGSMSVVTKRGKEYIRFVKSIEGNRIEVLADTPVEARKKMREKEKDILRGAKKKENNSGLLGVEMLEWHERSNLHRLKKRSWDRVRETIENQIAAYPIGKKQIQAIDDRDVQNLIHELINQEYSFSTVKKTYEVLNQFFTYIYFDDPVKNIMRKVKKPTKNSMQSAEKEIEFFDEDTGDLRKFLNEAVRRHANGAYVYRYGLPLCAMIFSLLRIGEATALRWSDIDFDREIIRVSCAASRVVDESAVPEDGVKHRYKIDYTTPKYDSVRDVPMSPNCKRYLEDFKKYICPASEDDYVFATKNGTVVSERNLRRCLNNIQKAAGMTVQNSGFHVLRHTGITLFVRKKVPETTIARMAGQKDLEMIHRIYLHITDLDIKKAVDKVDLPEFY